MTFSQSLKDNPVIENLPSIYRQELILSSIASMVENPEKINDWKPWKESINNKTLYPSEININKNFETIIPDYVIITNEAMAPAFQRLADWKTKKGTPTIIKTVESIIKEYRGGDTAEKIRSFLKEANKKWGDGLFVLLGGDHPIIPAKFRVGRNNDRQAIDLYYVMPDKYLYTLEENKSYCVYTYNSAPFTMGRLPVKSVEEANLVINKILTYENPRSINTDYFTNVLLSAAYIDKSSNNFLNLGCMTALDTLMRNCESSGFHKWYLFDHFGCTCSNHKSEKYDLNAGEELNKENFFSALNTGGNSGLGNFHFVYHMDHCNPISLGASQKDKNEDIKVEDIKSLNNGSFYQIFFSSGCHPGDFTKDCIGEELLLKENGGAIAFIGNTDVGLSSENRQWESFYNSLLKNMGRYDIGYHFKNIFPTSQSWRLHLLADPEMPIWTSKPKNLNVYFKHEIIENGINKIDIQVKNLSVGEKARICLYKPNEGYKNITVEDNGVHTFTFIPHTEGNINLTITAHNYFPYEKDIPVNIDNRRDLFISRIEIDDQAGNNNNLIDGGELINLKVEMNNPNSYSLSNLEGTIACDNSSVEIIEKSAFYKELSANKKDFVFVFPIRIPYTIPSVSMNEINSISFLLETHDSEGYVYTDDFNIEVHTSNIELGQQTVISTSNGDELIQANEIVDFNVVLYNEGDGDALDISAILYPLDISMIKNCDSKDRKYPIIPSHKSSLNNIPFRFETSNTYIQGNPLNFHLTVEDCYGKKQDYIFNLLDKPKKISDINYRAYKNEIEMYWPATSGVRGYNIYRSLTDAPGSYVRLNELPIPSPLFRDYNLKSNSAYYYKVSSISPTGNESVLSDSKCIRTIFPNMGVFPTKIYESGSGQILHGLIRSSVNVADIYHNNQKHIFAVEANWNYENASVIGLTPAGYEAFNTDMNNTTTSEFAQLNVWSEATPAIGNIFGDNELYMLVSSRDIRTYLNKLTCYSFKDDNKDGNPDIIWEIPINGPCYRGVVLANVDNSDDGSLEIIIRSSDTSAPITILDCNGELLSEFGEMAHNSYAALAVADLDHDGTQEIVAGYKDGVYVWHHDGTPFSNNPIKKKAGYIFNSTPTICDIDNDGEKEILIMARKEQREEDQSSEGIIMAIKMDGSYAQGWNESQKIICQNTILPNEITVGDINNSGSLEVVNIGLDIVKVWKNDGSILFSKTIPNLRPSKMAPILADIDDNPEDCEIIFGSSKNYLGIIALKNNGDMCSGFPLEIEENTQASFCVDDIDNDGFNELIVPGDCGTIYCWKTLGRSTFIEWGSERRNMQNTGEYISCKDLTIKKEENWFSKKYICKTLFIEKGGKLILNSGTQVSMSDGSLIFVKSGGVLEINDTKISNANIFGEKGSYIIINNSEIKLSNSRELHLEKSIINNSYIF